MELVPISGLDETARVTHMASYGLNVFWAMIEDASGKKTQVCIDLRAESPTRSRLFEQARHPNQTGARLLELGCEEEGIAIPLISRWLDSEEPSRMGIHDKGIELLKMAFLKLGESI